MSESVAVWEVPLSDRVYKIEFEHGTTTGKRIIKVDGKEVLRKDFMFKLVGMEHFEMGKHKATIHIRAVNGFTYQYSLTVNGKQLQKFREKQSKIMKTWTLMVEGEETRIVLEKDTLDVWVNGQVAETAGEFVEDGTETHFALGPHQAYIKAISSGNKREGLIYALIVDDQEIPESAELNNELHRNFTKLTLFCNYSTPPKSCY